MQRRLLRLRQFGNSDEPYRPGAYGFLQTPMVGNRADALVDALAYARPPACFVQNGVTFSPGTLAAAHEGINVRFDIYEGSMSTRSDDPNYRPSPNVRKGYITRVRSDEGNSCA